MATAPARRSMLIGFAATLAVGLLALGGLSAAIAISSDGQVLTGVRVGGVEVGGLTRAEAEARLTEDLPSLSDGQAMVAAGGLEEIVTYAELGRGYQLDAMLDAAFGVGRDAGPVGDGIARLRTLVRSTSLPVVVHPYDADAIDAAAERVARAVTIHPVEAAVEREGFAVRPSSDGRVLEAEDVRAALAAATDSTNPDDIRLDLAVATVLPVVNSEEAEAAAAAAGDAVADLELTVPGAAEDEDALQINAETIAGWITFGPSGESDYAMRIDAGAVGAAIAELAETIDREAVSARFGVAGSGLGGVIPGQDGRQLDVGESAASVVEALGRRAGGSSVAGLALTVDVTEPALTTAAAEEILPQMRMVSSWTTYYVSGEGNGFGNNISIPAWDLDGYNLAPGEWFSFWGGIGPVSVERGYRYGGAIINGRSVAQGALAGGICSTSTTLFNAAMRFGLEIGDRTAHYYYIDRYPTGLDATVAIVDSSVTDMTFRNDTEHPIVIRGFGSPGQVTFQIWSVPNGRTVALSAPIIQNSRSAIETTQLDPNMAPGTARRVEYPHHGFQATVSRTVYGPGGEVVHQNTWFSDYRVVNGITLVGPTAAAPEPPADEGETAGEPPAGDPPADPAP
ncbi:MAG TPA: VanW family protein [Candidatus Limnocylindria bacterium]